MSVVSFAAPAVVDQVQLDWTAAVVSWLLAVPLLPVTRFAYVIGHEGGHAAVGTLLFQKVTSIRFKRDGGGATGFEPPIPWLFDIAITAAGYLGPSLFGLLGAELLAHGASARSVLWGSIGFLVVMLLAVRGFLGWLLVPALIVGLGYLAIRVPAGHQALYAHIWVWFLLIAPVEHAVILVTSGLYKAEGGDTHQLRRRTLLPMLFWAVLLLAGTVVALGYGGRLLLTHR